MIIQTEQLNSPANTQYDHRLRGGYTGEHSGHHGNMPRWMRNISTCQPVKEESQGRTYNMKFADGVPKQ